MKQQKGSTLDQALKLRLARSHAILESIDRRRAQSGNQGIGWAIEKRILDRELEGLDAEASGDAAAGSAGKQHFTS